MSHCCPCTALAPACPSPAALQCLTGGVCLPKQTLQGPRGSGPACEYSLQLSWAAQLPPRPGAASGAWDLVCPRGASAPWDGGVGMPGLPTAQGHPSLITPALLEAEGRCCLLSAPRELCLPLLAAWQWWCMATSQRAAQGQTVPGRGPPSSPSAVLPLPGQGPGAPFTPWPPPQPPCRPLGAREKLRYSLARKTYLLRHRLVASTQPPPAATADPHTCP